MAIADRYTKPDTRSAFEKWLDSLTPENRAVVDGWLNTYPGISHEKMVELIRTDDPEDGFTGYKTTKGTISEYRRNVLGIRT